MTICATATNMMVQTSSLVWSFIWHAQRLDAHGLVQFHEGDEPHPFTEDMIMQAEDLYGVERSTHSFARLRIGRQTPQQTNVVWSSCDPVWEEALSFRWRLIHGRASFKALHPLPVSHTVICLQSWSVMLQSLTRNVCTEEDMQPSNES